MGIASHIVKKGGWLAKKSASLIGGLIDLSTGKTYFPERERKPFGERLMDNIKIVKNTHALERFYLLYGMDTKGFDSSNYIGYHKLLKERDIGNRLGQESSQIALLRDKYLFYLYMTQFGQPVPKVFGMVNNGRILDAELNEIGLEGLKDRRDFFIKIIDGECASFVKHIDTVDDLKRLLDDGTIASGRYILQERVIQHEAMSAINPHAINTYRIITIMKQHKPIYFSGVLRCGTKESGNVDNWAAGGIAVGIDRKAGHFKQWGFLKPGHGTKTEVHPDTGVRFADVKAPYYEEAVAAALKAHACFYGVQSIGWDVAISKDGPVFIEGNDNWEVSLMQVCDKGLKKEWEDAIS